MAKKKSTKICHNKQRKNCDLLNLLKECVLEMQKGRKKIKFSELAKYTGINKNTLFSVFEGSKNPTLHIFEQLFNIVGCKAQCNKTTMIKKQQEYKRWLESLRN